MNRKETKSQLFETIKCKDGIFYNLEFHQARLDLARKSCLGCNEKILLKEILAVPVDCKNGLFRCRVIYSQKIEKIEFIPHQIRKIQSLKLVYDNEIDYEFKFTDREKLSSLFNRRENCDDILIIKNGFVTDSYTANPIFFDGKHWWTPDTTLLPGTQRARLISEQKLNICRISADDIPKYKTIGLINAMQNFEDMPVIGIEKILH